MSNSTNNQNVETTVQPYNHDAKDIATATGVDIDAINGRLDTMYESLPEELSASRVAEALENSFSKRELAVMLERKTYEVGKMSNPLAALFGGQDEE